MNKSELVVGGRYRRKNKVSSDVYVIKEIKEGSVLFTDTANINSYSPKGNCLFYMGEQLNCLVDDFVDDFVPYLESFYVGMEISLRRIGSRLYDRHHQLSDIWRLTRIYNMEESPTGVFLNLGTNQIRRIHFGYIMDVYDHWDGRPVVGRSYQIEDYQVKLLLDTTGKLQLFDESGDCIVHSLINLYPAPSFDMEKKWVMDGVLNKGQSVVISAEDYKRIQVIDPSYSSPQKVSQVNQLCEMIQTQFDYPSQPNGVTAIELDKYREQTDPLLVIDISSIRFKEDSSELSALVNDSAMVVFVGELSNLPLEVQTKLYHIEF